MNKESTSVKLNSGQDLPLVGFGTSRLADGDECYQAVLWALKAGYRHIDTAAMYGNEASVGRAVRDSGVNRSDIFVTTKLDNALHHRVEDAFDENLQRLGLDYIDLYLIHWPMPGRLAAWKVLEKLVGKGMWLKAIGVSNFTIRHLDELLAQAEIVPAVNQFEHHPFLFQPQLLDYLKTKGIQPVAYSPLTRAGKLDHPVIAAIAQSHDKSPAQVMLRWNIQQQVAVIPRSKNQDRIAQNLKVFGWSLSEQEMSKLSGLSEGYRVTEDPEGYR